MATLTQEQLTFLLRYEIAPSRVFDATGHSRDEYQAIMEALDMLIAYGVSPCRRAGHTLRTRAGHCIQCTPANLSYLRRYDEHGDVYVAESVANSVTKVGTSRQVVERVRNLNDRRYGGCSDWVLVHQAAASRAGRVEVAVHQKLSKYAVCRS